MKKILVYSILMISCIIPLFSLYAELPPLIPRDVLFGNPSKSGVRISPDGAYLSYLAPADGVMNIWLKDLKNKSTHDKQITFDTNRGIQKYMWAPAQGIILYIQDTNGDENWRLYGLNIATGKTWCYTPFENVSVRLCDINLKYPTEILITMNKRNPALHDLYKLHLDTNILEMIAENPGSIVSYLTDSHLQLRGAYATCPDGGADFLWYNNGDWEHAIHWDIDDASLSGPLCFDVTGNYLYFLDSRASDTNKLIELNREHNTTRILAHNEHFNISNALFHPFTGKPIAACIEGDRTEWIVLDQEMKKYFDAAFDLEEGELHVLNSDGWAKFFVIAFEKDTGPIRYYIFDTELCTGHYLFDNKPELNDYTLAPMHPVAYTSRDGLTIHGYITLPVGIEAQNLPLVVYVHGGPTTRDSWGYDPAAQWLANRGYAVLQINYRGSSGFGKKFEAAGNREWGGKMHDDLIDGIEWAKTQGFANPEKIAIYGGSYGGYAALVGATFTPDVFCCAVDVVGPSNLLTLLESIPAYWHVFKGQLYKKIGNPETEPEFIMSRSPLFKVDNIKIPLMIAQGANDPRVKQSESEQIVAALKEKNIPHHYLLFHDEGHGFVKPENRIRFYTAAEQFFAQHLGGRCEEPLCQIK